MSEGTMAIVKPEMKSYIWVQTADGSIQQVEEEVAMFCPMICREVLQTGMGSSKNYAISLPQRVNPAVLGLILDYCRFHQLPGRSNKERKTFDEKFVRLDTKKLCELTSAADSLQLRPLVDLTSRALARMIEGKTPEEIRETFNLPDDLTEVIVAGMKSSPSHPKILFFGCPFLCSCRRCFIFSNGLVKRVSLQLKNLGVSLPPVTRRIAKASLTVKNTPSSPARSSPLNSPESVMAQILENLADILLAVQRSMDTIATTVAAQGTTLAAQGNTLAELRRDKLEIEVMVSTHDLGVYGLASMSDCAAIICSTDIAGKLKIEE
ncbi:SKP1-like protein 20 [Camellia sinensis]|uniref:SKP1-like protein 20 n=1 Tax=Camellia sinensis TaxID=4442 RepID=UPI00103642A8|nr:SKP1-like protein 20 [Camellia sinensis]